MCTVCTVRCIYMYTFCISVYFQCQTLINSVENGADLIQDNIAQLKAVMKKVRNDRQNTNPLTMKLNGTLDAAVNGGVSNFDVSFHMCLRHDP